MPEMIVPRAELRSDEKVVLEVKSEDRKQGDCKQGNAPKESHAISNMI